MIEDEIAEQAKVNASQYGIELVSVGIRHSRFPPNKTQNTHRTHAPGAGSPGTKIYN